MENAGSSKSVFWNSKTNFSSNDTPSPAVTQTMTTINGKFNENPSVGIIPTRLQVLTDQDVFYKGCHKAGEQVVSSQSNKSNRKGGMAFGNGFYSAFDHYSQSQMLPEKKNSPEPLVTSSCLGAPGSLFVQCLELEQSQSPSNKLERLKERIKEQRKLQKEQQFARTASNTSQEPSIPVLWQKTHNGDRDKCLVRKVTFAPSAPAYKGFNAIKLISEGESSSSMERSEIRDLAVNIHTSRRGLMQHRDYRHQVDSNLQTPIPEQRRKRQQNSKRDHEAIHKARNSSRTMNPKDTAKVNGSYSSDVFSWKQGRRLIRMLLGPPPKLPKSPDSTRDVDDRNRQKLSDKQVKDIVRPARSSLFDRSVRRRLYAANEDDQHRTPMKTGWLDPAQACLEPMQLSETLKGLQSGTPAGMNPNLTGKMGDGNANLEVKFGENDHDRCLVTPKRHKCLVPHEVEKGGPNHWSNSLIRNCVFRQKPHLMGERRPLLPKCSAGSCKAEMGNLGDQAQSPVARRYNAKEVREYMNRQMVQRRRQESERKRLARQAMEMKKKRLQEVYRKQKEAISKQKRCKQRSTLPAQHFVDRCNNSTKPERSLGTAQLMKDRAPTRGRPEAGGFAESGSWQQDLKYPTGPLCKWMSGRGSPLRIQDLGLLHCSPKLSSHSILSNQPLATCEQETSCNATLHRNDEHRNKQQRIKALRSMATGLSGRIEDEMKRLGVETGTLPSFGVLSSNQGWKESGLGWPLGENAAGTPAGGCGLDWQIEPQSCVVTSPSVLTAFTLLSNSLHKWGGQMEIGQQQDKYAGSKSDLEVKDLVDELLCHPSSQSDDLLWSDSEPLAECELVSNPRKPSDQLLAEDKGLVDRNDHDLGMFSKGNHQLDRKVCVDDSAFDTFQPENWSLGRRGSWEAKNMQDGNKSLIQRIKRLGSPPGTMPPGVKQSAKGKENGGYHCLHDGRGPKWWRRPVVPIVEPSNNYARTESPRSSGLSIQNGRPLADSMPAVNIGKVTAKEMVQRKEDPVTQRLAELMKHLEKETEELSFRCRINRIVKEDSMMELKRSSVSPDSTEHLTETRSRARAENSLDGKGTDHTSVIDGSLMNDKLRSLLPSESHYRQTMETIKNLHLGNSQVRHRPGNSFSKWEETGRPIFGNPDAFSRFTLEMAHQYLQEEDIRARHQTALFRLREKALKEKTKAELAWLQHQKIHFQNKGQDDKRPVIVGKQREVLLKLQKEKADIRHLQNACQVAHQERKLLLKQQQQEIFRIHQSTADLQWQLGRSATASWFSGVKDISLSTTPDSESTHLNGPEHDQDAESSAPGSLLGKEGNSAMDQMKEMPLDERFLARKEEELVRRRRQAMDVLVRKKSFDMEEPVSHRTEMAIWSPQVRDHVPSTEAESAEHLEITKMVTWAADFSMDKLIKRKQNTQPAEILKQISTVVLEPSEKLVMKATKNQSGKGFLASETTTEPTAGEADTSPLSCKLVSCKEKMSSIWSEQRRQQRERLKMEEAELRRQLEVYDAYISRSQAELILDTDVNYIQKPQIKTPTAAQCKSRVNFPWLQRSNLLQHSAKEGAMVLQSQDLPSEQDKKAKDVVNTLKPQEMAAAEDLPSPSKTKNDEKLSHSPKPQPHPPSNSLDCLQTEENHPEIAKLCVHPDSLDTLNIAAKQSVPSTNFKEEILQCNVSDYSACNRTSSSDLVAKIFSAEQNVAMLPLKQRESLFERIAQLHPNDFWSNFPMKISDTYLQISQYLEKSNTSLDADQGEEFEMNQSSTFVMNAEDIKENRFGFCFNLTNLSGFMPSSNQQPALELRSSEISCQEMIAAESPPWKADDLCAQASVPLPLKSSCWLKEDAGLLHCQWILARDFRTAEVISAVNFLSFIDDFSSIEDKSEDIVLLNRGKAQLSGKGILCTNETFQSLAQEANSLRSEAVEELALYIKDLEPASISGIASTSVKIIFLNAEGMLCSQQDLLPVLKTSCKKKSLDIPFINSSAQKEKISLVEEISFINEELSSPIKEDNMHCMNEFKSVVDESMLYENETFSPPAEASISFENEDFPPLPEEIIICQNKELSSPSRESGNVRTEDLAPSSTGNSSIYESSVSDKKSVDFTCLSPPHIEKMMEEIKSNVAEKCPLRTSGDQETTAQFCGDSLLVVPLRIHQSQTEQRMGNHLKWFPVKDQVMVDNKEPDSLTFKGHTTFGQDYCGGAELHKSKGKHYGAFFELKYIESRMKCGKFVTPEEISQQWHNFDDITDIINCEDSFSEGPPMPYQRNLDEELKQAHSFEEEPEEKVNEKGIAPKTRDKRPISDQGDQGEAHWSGRNDLELEWVILERTKTVESFLGSQDLCDAELEHLDAHLNSGLVCTWAQQHSMGKNSEQSVNDAEEYLSEHLAEGTLSEVTSIRDQKNQNTQKRVSQHHIQQCYSELTHQKFQPVKGRRDHDRSYKEDSGLYIPDYMQLQDKSRIAKASCSQNSIDNVTKKLIIEIIDEARKEYKKIKRKGIGNKEAKLILCPQPAVECWTVSTDTIYLK
ncbi:uncharacterized protein [Narcine bancroftii]|uniref:uncharacterized protein n=1 Tax=Narcine bancroftii TaxID=1343680 RepID=UPI003831863E